MDASIPKDATRGEGHRGCRWLSQCRSIVDTFLCRRVWPVRGAEEQ